MLLGLLAYVFSVSVSAAFASPLLPCDCLEVQHAVPDSMPCHSAMQDSVVEYQSATDKAKDCTNCACGHCAVSSPLTLPKPEMQNQTFAVTLRFALVNDAMAHSYAGGIYTPPKHHS